MSKIVETVGVAVCEHESVRRLGIHRTCLDCGDRLPELACPARQPVTWDSDPDQVEDAVDETRRILSRHEAKNREAEIADAELSVPHQHARRGRRTVSLLFDLLAGDD